MNLNGNVNADVPSILWLGESLCHRRELVGGKAANLSKLAAKYPVPPGFCLTAASFQAPGALSMDRQISAQIASAYQTLSKRSDQSDPRVAVRSSAIDEDGSAASYAGQYESFLNVEGADAVLKAINRCWESASSERLLAYRKQQGLPGASPVAVLVQHMVPADISAVVFSANPITNNTSEIVINASWGLGESIVGGTVTPDTYIVEKQSLSIKSIKVADKQWMTVQSETGTQEVKIPRMLRTQPALNDEQILEMALLAHNLERDMGWLVDLECAYQADQLFLLQCRPVTTVEGAK